MQSLGISSDQGHLHVISEIRNVYEKLKRHALKSLTAEWKDDLTSKGEEDVISLFKHLDIEPLEDGDDDESSLVGVNISETNLPVKLSKNRRKKRKLKQKRKQRRLPNPAFIDDGDEDPYFVLTCLLSDLNSMRDYIKQIWQEYRDGRLDLMTVSLTTNATFDIIRTYKEDFPGISNLLSDYSKTIRLMLSGNLDDSDPGLSHMFNPFIDQGSSPLDQILIVGKSLSKIPKVANLVFANAFYFLNGPRHRIISKREGHKLRIVKKQKNIFLELNKPPNGAQLNTVERLQEDVRLLAHFAQEVYFSDHHHNLIPDHFTMHWTEGYAKDSNPTISLDEAFSAQIHLDIHHVLQDDTRRGFEDFCAEGIKMNDSIEKSKRCTLQDDDEKKSSQETLAFIQDRLQKLHRDKEKMPQHRSAVEEACQMQGKDNEKDFGDLSFLQLNSLLCGVLLFQLKHYFRNTGLYLTNYFATMKFAGQFYYTCQMQRSAYNTVTARGQKMRYPQFLNPLKWEDMDFIFDLYGEETFFQGHQPRSNWDIIKYNGGLDDAMIGLGIKEEPSRIIGHIGPIETIPKSQKKIPESSQIRYAKDLYSYESIAVTHRLFHSKYADYSGKPITESWTVETLQALLENQLQQKGPRRIQEDEKRAKEGKRGRFRTTMKEIDGDVHQLTILETLKETLQSESRALNFDFVSFHINCFDLLCALRLNNRHRFNMDRFPDAKYYKDVDIRFVCALLHHHINVSPTLDKEEPLIYIPGEEEVALFTTEGHIAVDTIIQRFLEDLRCKDYELNKIDGIKGIPASVPTSYKKAWVLCSHT